MQRKKLARRPRDLGKPETGFYYAYDKPYDRNDGIRFQELWSGRKSTSTGSIVRIGVRARLNPARSDSGLSFPVVRFVAQNGETMSEETPPCAGAGENPLQKMLDNPPLCGQCLTGHWPDEPHDPTTLAYQNWFESEHGQRPTYMDAVEHCDPLMKEVSRKVYIAYGLDPDTPAGLAWKRGPNQ